ncbi:TauD/TfdA family dioxygenase [Leucothrix sargassi]|nr:TauD/TfdA family dioxygenase [Leucothrix sargassi]
MKQLHIKKLSGHVGAEISDVSLADLSPETFTAIQSALYEHGVIFFRDQHLTPEQHLAFAKRWGKIDVSRFFKAVEGYPEIAEIRTQPDQKIVVGSGWHTDQSFDPAPAMASILSAQELPEFGGDTLFASMTAAYDQLSDGLKKTFENLNAWHTDDSFAKAESVLPDVFSAQERKGGCFHPVILKHPVTGRKALYVNDYFTTHFEGWTEEESAPLLKYLYNYATQPPFCCRFTWTPGCVAMWDNRLVMHYAAGDYYGQTRLMHRVTIEGVPLS